MQQRTDYLGNTILYEMCKRYPLHTDINEIYSKIWLIGRSYAAAIERKAGTFIVQGHDFVLEQAAPKIKENKQIDAWINSVKNISRLNNLNLRFSLECHKNVTDLFKIITGLGKRSLASKYLHFHAPDAFFLYDSLASLRIRKLLKGQEKPVALKGFDNEYAMFCALCLQYREQLEKQLNMQITPRQLDMELLGYGFVSTA